MHTSTQSFWTTDKSCPKCCGTPKCRTRGTFSNRDTDSELVIMHNGKRFVIYLFADNFSESPQLRERHLFFLEVAETTSWMA